MMEKIYKITNTINGRIYVGKTKDFSKRITFHFSMLKSGQSHHPLLQMDYNEFGRDAYEVKVLAEMPDATPCERFLIEQIPRNLTLNVQWSGKTPDPRNAFEQWKRIKPRLLLEAEEVKYEKG